MVTDARGRRESHRRQSTGKRVQLSERDLLWLEKLHQHGALPTSYLLAYSAALRANDKRQKERFGDLFHEDSTTHGGPYLDRPPQQFATLKAGYNQLVHQVAPAGLKALREAGHVHKSASHHGPWVHRHMVACITASIELATIERPDLSFIPQHAILDRAQTDLRCTLQLADPTTGTEAKRDLVPDALFGLTYHTRAGDKFRFFVVEADRGTEPITSRNWNRKSWQRHLVQYDAYIARQAYKEHLKLTAPLLVLNVVPDPPRQDLMLNQTRKQLGACPYQLFQTFEAFAAPWRPPEPNLNLLQSPWQSTGGPFHIDQV